MWASQPSRSRWQIAAGLSDIDTMDGRGECSDYRNRKDSCEDRQSHMRTPSVAPVEIVVHGQHLLEHESTQPLETGSSAAPSSSDLVPPPPRTAKAAEFSRKHIPAATASHNTFAPHQVVAIIVRMVRIGIGGDDPERNEVAEVARPRH